MAKSKAPAPVAVDRDEITMRALRANWPIISVFLMGVMYSATAVNEQANMGRRLETIESLVSVQSIAEYAAFVAITKERHKISEQRISELEARVAAAERLINQSMKCQ